MGDSPLSQIASVVTILQFFLGLYVAIADRPKGEQQVGVPRRSGLTAGKRLVIIVTNAILVGGFWELYEYLPDTPLFIVLLLSSPFMMSFWIAFHAPTRNLAVQRAIFSGCLCGLPIYVMALLAEPISNSTMEDQMINIPLFLGFVGFISAVVGAIAFWINQLLTD